MGETCRENTRFNQQGEIALIAELPLAKPVEKGVLSFFFCLLRQKRQNLRNRTSMHCMLCGRFAWPSVENVALMFFDREFKLPTDAHAKKYTKQIHKKQTQTPYACSAPELKAIIVERLWNGSVRELAKKTLRVNLKKINEKKKTKQNKTRVKLNWLKCYQSELNCSSQGHIPRT